MANPEAIKFISEQLAAGHSEADIRAALKAKGWPDSEIDMAFSGWRGNPTLPERKDVPRFIGESWNIFRSLVPRIAHLYLQMLLKALYGAVPAVVAYAALELIKNSGQLDAGTHGLLMVIVTIAFVIFMAYIAIWLQVCLILLVRNRSVEVPPKQLMAEARPFILPFFGTSILNGILVFLWFLLFIIPGIAFAVYYNFAEYIVVDKNISGMGAIRLSKNYVQGLWWQVFFSLLGLAAVAVLCYIVIQVIGGVAGYGGGVFGQSVGGILGFLFQLAFMPYTVIYMWLVYERLKSLKPEVS
jgi:hypothetical protein